MTPERVGNCLLWLLAARKRLKDTGVIVRPSISRWHLGPISGRIPHFLLRVNRGRFSHVVSFCPIVRPDRPTLAYIALFRGRMIWGDAHAPETQFDRLEGKPGYGMLKAGLIVGAALLMVLVWLGWWAWRIGRWIWWLVISL